MAPSMHRSTVKLRTFSDLYRPRIHPPLCRLAACSKLGGEPRSGATSIAWPLLLGRAQLRQLLLVEAVVAHARKRRLFFAGYTTLRTPYPLPVPVATMPARGCRSRRGHTGPSGGGADRAQGPREYVTARPVAHHRRSDGPAPNMVSNRAAKPA